MWHASRVSVLLMGLCQQETALSEAKETSVRGAGNRSTLVDQAELFGMSSVSRLATVGRQSQRRTSLAHHPNNLPMFT